jgi:hypothetical protein
MTKRSLLIPAVACLWFAILPSARAHRVDEYLQATRLSIDTRRIDLELDLTPGIALASQVFGWIDTNGDGAISETESLAYSQKVLRSLVLYADGKPVAITLTERSFPTLRDMSLGVGTVRLKATAHLPAGGGGRHQISFLNKHRPDSSVYLVNALVPANPGVQIGDQRRDPAQHGLTLDYTVAADPPSAWTYALLAGFVVAARWFIRRRNEAIPVTHRWRTWLSARSDRAHRQPEQA